MMAMPSFSVFEIENRSESDASVPSTSKLSPEYLLFGSTPSLVDCVPCKPKPLQEVPFASVAPSRFVDQTADPLSEQRTDVKPANDTNIASDDRVLNNLLSLEMMQSLARADYFQSGLQPELKAYMRKITVEWMKDVCDEEKADMEVLAVAVRLMDRFLGLQPIFKQQLQGLATACLFLASKLKQPAPFDSTKLVRYTDNSVSMGELMSWEMLVLNTMDWDVACVTAFDFLPHMLSRIPIPACYRHVLKSLAHDVLCRIQSEHELAFLPPSSQACLGILAAAFREMASREYLEVIADFLQQICVSDFNQLLRYTNSINTSIIFEHENVENSAAIRDSFGKNLSIRQGLPSIENIFEPKMPSTAGAFA